jgi:putative tryptophan/tyrosine transport system substrate-binding protein
MRRRDLLALLGGAGAALRATTSCAQPLQRAHRLGIIMAVGKTPEYVAAVDALGKALALLGWRRDDNLVIDERWSSGDEAHARSTAAKIIASHPDVVLGQSATVIGALSSQTRTVPVIFVHVANPVASGFVRNLARPVGNVTGITNVVPSIGGKWLQLLKEAAPGVTRAAMLVNPDTQPDRGAMLLDPFEAAARSLGVSAKTGEVRDLEDIEAAMAGLAAEPRGGVVVIPDAFFASHSGRIVALAERFQLPAIYPYGYYVAQGGLLSYGVNNVGLFRQAAPYIDRLLRGATPADLPVHQPTRFELVVNLKTAKALGLSLPADFVLRADEVLE